jgi:3-hydroxyisobutyrate/3-hydroxypropionate dehydrogenase
MGYPMALNLRSKMPPTSTLLIADVSAPALSSFQAQMSGKGPIKEVSNGFEAVQAADVVVTMLPGSAAVKSVYLDEKTGIIAGAKAAGGRKKKMVMECGTIETSTILEVGKAVRESSKESGLTFVDAPVSGGPMGAEKGTPTFMVGSGPDAEPETFETAKSVLQHMGVKENVFLCGDVGAGTAFKIINNYLSAITSLAASEALNIGVKMGLDPKKLTDVINVSGGQCWVTSASNPVPGVQENVPSSRGYEGGFRIELCKKVLGMGTELAEMVGARTELDGVAMRAFEEAANDERYKGKDARVVYKWLSESERRK